MRVSSTPRLIGSITDVSGILDHPPEPVIGLAEGETRWRVMTAEGVATDLHFKQPQLSKRAACFARGCKNIPPRRMLDDCAQK
jgi:hypothetical protein